MQHRWTILTILLGCLPAAVPACAQVQPIPDKAARLRSQELFEGSDDQGASDSGAYRARLTAMCVDASSAVLGLPQLAREAPSIAAGQPRTPALVPGSDFFMLFFQAMAPSIQKGNYYSLLTLRQDPEDPRGRSYQQRLEDAILDSPGKLEPAGVIRLALDAAHGNYPLAMLTAHNLFKEITYRGRDEVDINTRARQALPEGRAPLDTYGIDPRFGRFASKLAPLRLSANKDKMGPWYHFFVPLAAEAWASRHSAFWMEAFEHGARHVGLLSSDDPEKQRIDECALRAAYSVHEGLAGRPEEAVQPAEQAAVPRPGPSAPPTGKISVQLADDLNYGDSIPFWARVTLISEDDGGRTVIDMAPETEEEVPAGVYIVRARVLDTVLRGMTDSDDSSNPAEWYTPGEERDVVVKAGKLTRVVVRIPNTRGNLTVTVRDEKAQPLAGVSVALAGPMPAGPFESPAAFQVAPGSYRAIVPDSVVNGRNYRGKAVAATVIANQSREVVIDLEPYPELPQARAISTEPGWLSLNVGDDYELSAAVRDDQGRAIPGVPVLWSSSNAAVASVDAFGKVTGRGRGQARITVRSGNAAGSIPVTVSSGAMLARCEIAKHPKHLPAGGGGFDFRSIAYDTDGKPLPDVSFTWTGSNYTVALVNAKTGRLTTEKPGVITIYAQAKGRDAAEALCSAEITVDASYEHVLVSGEVVRPDGSAASGATVKAAGSEAVTANATGRFAVMAANGPHAEGAAIAVDATLGTSSGRASGLVKDGAVKNIRIALGGGSNQAAAAGTKRRIDAHLFRLWPIGNPKEVQFLLYAKASRNESGHFSFPDGNGGMYWRDGEDLGFYADEDAVCAVLRGYGRNSVDYNLYWYSVTCPTQGPVARPQAVSSGSPQATASAVAGTAPALATLSGTVTVDGRPLGPRDGLPMGSSLEVGRGSRASMRFPDGSTVHIGEGSKVRIADSRRVELLDGSMEVEHNHAEGAPSFEALEVATPDARIVPTGTRYWIDVSSRGSGFAVLEGTARVTGSMLARTDAAFQVAGKTSFTKAFDMKAGDRVFAFRLPSWTAASASPLGRPDPWNDARVQQLIDEWLRIATPETAARYPGPWRYSDWGITVGPGTTVAGPPDHPAGWSRYQMLWAYRTRFGSLNACTLGEFVERRLAGKGLDGCAHGTAARAGVPSWMNAPSRGSQVAAPAVQPEPDPLVQARAQVARAAGVSAARPAPVPQQQAQLSGAQTAAPPRPQEQPPARPLKLDGVWSCLMETTFRRGAPRGTSAPPRVSIHIGANNALLLDEKGTSVPPLYVRGNSVGYRVSFNLFDVTYTATYDMELRGDVLAGTGNVEGSDGLLAAQRVTCSGRYDPKR